MWHANFAYQLSSKGQQETWSSNGYHGLTQLSLHDVESCRSNLKPPPNRWKIGLKKGFSPQNYRIIMLPVLHKLSQSQVSIQIITWDLWMWHFQTRDRKQLFTNQLNPQFIITPTVLSIHWLSLLPSCIVRNVHVPTWRCQQINFRHGDELTVLVKSDTVKQPVLLQYFWWCNYRLSHIKTNTWPSCTLQR